VVDGLGQELAGRGDQVGQGVQPDGGVAEPAAGAEPGELTGGLVEDLVAVLAGGGSAEGPRRLRSAPAEVNVMTETS
jgi:hypothetical protein